MKDSILLYRGCLWWSLPATSIRLCISAFSKQLSHSVVTTALDEEGSSTLEKNRGEWFTVPPFSPTIRTSVLGKKLSSQHTEQNDSTGIATTTTAVQWILQSCPQLPRAVVHKLFRLRQVRREVFIKSSSDLAIEVQERKLKRVAAKDSLNLGDRMFLPNSVKERLSKKQELPCNEEEMSFIRGLVLHKDAAIIVLNKPPGMPVQGGVGIGRSLDELAATCLTYDYPEPPRLVHRLDRDSSGVLVLGRTQKSATLLHSLFREKTSSSKENFGTETKFLQRRYLALVIGHPKTPRGLISAPLQKVMVDDGNSERITISDNPEIKPSQHALTEYRVISSCQGYSWLELSPLTGRKHQLRVHCAEALETPIVGDYKYGWLAHKKLKHLPWYDSHGLHLENKSTAKKEAHLHLHCKEMILPNVSPVLRNLQSISNADLSKMDSLSLVAPLPPHMKNVWEFLHS